MASQFPAGAMFLPLTGPFLAFHNQQSFNSRFISVKMRLTNKIVEKRSIFIEENFRCGRIKKKAGNENQYRI